MTAEAVIYTDRPGLVGSRVAVGASAVWVYVEGATRVNGVMRYTVVHFSPVKARALAKALKAAARAIEDAQGKR